MPVRSASNQLSFDQLLAKLDLSRVSSVHVMTHHLQCIIQIRRTYAKTNILCSQKSAH